MARLGMTIPLQTVPLPEHERFVKELADLGYTDVWTSEAKDVDGFTPLALASQWSKTLRLGCACFPVQTRGPALLAMSAATLALAAPGRFVLGIGSSSEFIVKHQNARPFERPFAYTRDTARFLRAALRHEKVRHEYESFAVRGFQLRSEIPGSPRWSPDGRSIVFGSQGQDGRYDVWTIGVDGSGLRQVTRDPADDVMPSLSRDGRFLYFSSNRTGRYEVWRVAAVGGAEEQVTQEGGCIPVESLDGRTLYYIRTCRADALLARPTAGGEERTIFKCVD